MNITREQVEQDLAMMENRGVPSHIADSLRAYALDGVRPGSFTSACIVNDFLDAVCLAGPEITIRHLTAIAKTLFNDMPSAAWGAMSKREKWIGHRGVGGLS